MVFDTQVYSVYLLKGATPEGAVFLFKFKQRPAFRPHLGDSITNPRTQENFKIMIDRVPASEDTIVRSTNGIDIRVTDSGDTRITQLGLDLDEVTHLYYVTYGNNPNRISSWTTSRFANDRTMDQLFRWKYN